MTKSALIIHILMTILFIGCTYIIFKNPELKTVPKILYTSLAGLFSIGLIYSLIKAE